MPTKKAPTTKKRGKPSSDNYTESRQALKNQCKPYTCVVVDYDAMMIKHGYPVEPFKDGDLVLMLGEIEFSSGHVAVVTQDGLVRWGYHAENFRKLTEDEV